MSVRSLWRAEHPAAFYLDSREPDAITHHLQSLGWLSPGERVVAASTAGEGNMNYTLRVELQSGTTMILKQARPWVEKYNAIAAPVERAGVEAAFYQIVSGAPSAAASMPALRGFDPDAKLLWLEDLGDAPDLRTLYAGDQLTPDELTWLREYLHLVHAAPATPTQRDQIANRAMRALNHEHIFRFPLQPENGLNLEAFTPGLSGLARRLQSETAYVERVRRLGELYLSDGPSLLHGDYFPGSWLRTPQGLQVIDPEFCFFGPPEFDHGVLHAHLLLAQQNLAIEPASELTRAFTGVEIMRRLLGVAQLPLPYGLDEKARLLELARTMVLH